jgi:hypothetical protein
LQGFYGTAVSLYGDDLPGSLQQQGTGQAARAGTDLDAGAFSEVPGGAGNAPGEVEIEEKILAERFTGRKLVGG